MNINSKSGQAMLIYLLLLMVLVIPVLITVNRSLIPQSISSLKKLQQNAIAEEGLAYAIRFLSEPGSPPPNWPFLGGTGLPVAPVDIESVQGGSFRITYTQGPSAALGLQSYQIGVLVQPLDKQGAVVPGSLFAMISKKTLAVKLPSGTSASALLEVSSKPYSVAGGLWAYYGPIVCHDESTASAWRLDRISDSQYRPRKFSQGGITGVTAVRSETSPITRTDEKEFWAYTSVGVPSIINLEAYKAMAKASLCIAPIGCSGLNCKADPEGSCFFPNVDVETAIFDGGGSAPGSTGYTVNCEGCAIYVKGNAIFQHVTLNVGQRGAIIIHGNLTLDDNRDPVSVPSTPTSCPPTRCLDANCDVAESNLDTVNCGPTSHYVDIRGFLYVKGNMAASTPAWWAIDGAVRVDGLLTLLAGNVQLVYNDVVNHNILTNNFDLLVDSMTARN